ncbi:MAG: hypothetical protein JWO82_2175 [Akkermansiaceae bacterium]|nr:hypothetical protein [Akkermansiaceae bacterium]
MKSLPSSRILATAGFGLLLVGSSSGAVVVQELFDGITSSDSSINGKGDTATSIGLTGNWATNVNTGIYTAGNFDSGAGLPGLPASNGVKGGVWNNTGGNYDPAIYATRPLAAPINFAVAQTVYFSVILNNSGDTAMGIGLASGASGSSEFIGAGLTWNNARTLSTQVNDAGNAAYVSYGTLGADSGPYGVRNHEASGSINGPALLVGRITISTTGADLIDIKRYGVGSTIESDPSLVTWTASDSFNTSMVANNLVLWLNGNSGNNAGEVDAIRFGQSWGDVTGVPETGSALLGLLGAAMFFRRQRR